MCTRANLEVVREEGAKRYVCQAEDDLLASSLYRR